MLATITAGNVVLLIQPPRGFGENPVAIYHDPDLAPCHHYLAAYRWLERRASAPTPSSTSASTARWSGCPARTPRCRRRARTDAAIGNLPLIYPFLVNDPGEGAQAKRRAHATIVDHLIPPMARAESYGDIARLEQLLDEHANIAAMDPAKLPAIRGEIWQLMHAAEMHRDLGLDERPDDEEFDDFILHVDGWLCEIKDAQIRDGLHVLGQAPAGEARVNLVLAILRAAQVWGGETARRARACARRSGSRRTPRPPRAVDADRGRRPATWSQRMEDAGWDAGRRRRACTTTRRCSRCCASPPPRSCRGWRRTTDELDAVLHALDGGFVPAGPSGSPLRGLVNVLPTGRNFYTVDPRAVPSRLAWQTGQAMADSLVQRYLDETGELPRVGRALGVGHLARCAPPATTSPRCWRCSACARSGTRRRAGSATSRVVPLEELGRPRIDVTVRISGFFRDAFPHVVAMLDDAVRLVAGARRAGRPELRARPRPAPTSPSTATSGARPRGSSAPSRGRTAPASCRSSSRAAGATTQDLAEVYTAWGGFAYGRDLDGAPAADDMRANYRRIKVAAKNIDTREHDIADSDDYFQYHGGMVATVRALTGADPKAYVGDSTTPDAVRTRTLQEETNRVFRARVVNPRWIGAMQRHGYKGAFELAATVDYLFGFDATAGVVHDWMYEALAQEYVLDETNQAFMKQSNPWALRGIVEKLHEAADRGLWEAPDPEVARRDAAGLPRPRGRPGGPAVE